MALPELRAVGVREFRDELATFLDSPAPVAITRHGRTVGYFLPAHDPERLQADLAAFLASAARVEAILDEWGPTEGEVLDESRRRRSAGATAGRDRRDGAHRRGDGARDTRNPD